MPSQLNSVARYEKFMLKFITIVDLSPKDGIWCRAGIHQQYMTENHARLCIKNFHADNVSFSYANQSSKSIHYYKVCYSAMLLSEG